MSTYVILSRLPAESVKDPRALPRIAQDLSRALQERCPALTWITSYGALGRFDVVDIVESDSPIEVQKAASMLRDMGFGADAIALTPWNEFVDSLAGHRPDTAAKEPEK